MGSTVHDPHTGSLSTFTWLASVKGTGRFCVFLIAQSYLVGCASNIPLRTLSPEGTPCFSSGPADCVETTWFVQAESENVHYRIPIEVIEFKDQRDLRNSEHKDTVISQIRTLAQDSNLLLDVSAHGWKSNAASSNQNFLDFQTILSRLAIADREGCRNARRGCRKIVELDLGWREMYATWETFQTLPFWNRKISVHRIRREGVIEVLGEFRRIDASTGYSDFVLTGHRFGGGLVTSRTQQFPQRDLASPRYSDISLTLADLIVLVNPAIETALRKAIRKKSQSLEFETSQRPILTSIADTTTRSAFPIGRILSTLLTDYDKNRPDQTRSRQTEWNCYKSS